jgi:hypothetical protein
MLKKSRPAQVQGRSVAFFSDKFRRLVTTYHCASVDVGTEADCKGNPRLLSSTPQSCDDGFFRVTVVASASTPIIGRSVSHAAPKGENKVGGWADQISSLNQELQPCA